MKKLLNSILVSLFVLLAINTSAFAALPSGTQNGSTYILSNSFVNSGDPLVISNTGDWAGIDTLNLNGNTIVIGATNAYSSIGNSSYGNPGVVIEKNFTITNGNISVVNTAPNTIGLACYNDAATSIEVNLNNIKINTVNPTVNGTAYTLQANSGGLMIDGNLTVNLTSSTINGNYGTLVAGSLNQSSTTNKAILNVSNSTIAANGTGTTTDGTVANPNPDAQPALRTYGADTGKTEINLNSGAIITGSSNLNGIYAASTNNIINVNSGSRVSGSTGILLAAGTVNVDGGSITGTGIYSDTQRSYNGRHDLSTGAGVLIPGITNANHYQKPVLNIISGSVTSEQGDGIQQTENTDGTNGNFETQGEVEITGGDISGKVNSINLNNPSKATIGPAANFNPALDQEEYPVSPSETDGYIVGLNLTSNSVNTYYNLSATDTVDQTGNFVLSLSSAQVTEGGFTPENLNWNITQAGTGSTNPPVIATFTNTWFTDAQASTKNSTIRYTESTDGNWTLQYTLTSLNGLNQFSNLQLLYNGKGTQTGIFALNVAYTAPISVDTPGYVKNLTSNQNFVIENSNTTAVNITNVDGTTVSNPYTINLATGRTAQFGYTRTVNLPGASEPTTIVGGGNAYWSLQYTGTNASTGISANTYARVNSSTGVVTIIRPVPSGQYLLLSVVVDGVQSSKALLIGTTGTSTETITGIEPVYNPVYWYSTTSYELANNIVSLPYSEYVDPANLTFTTTNTDVVIYNTDNGYVALPLNSNYEGTAPITATLKLDNGISYTTQFELNFVGPNPIAATGITAEEALALNLENPVSENVNASLTPYNTTQQPISRGDYTYESSDEDIAVVDGFGNVTPIAVGEATITTSYELNGKVVSAKTLVAVTETPEPTPEYTLAIDPEALELRVDETGTLTANLDPEVEEAEYTWTIENEEVASLSESTSNTVEVTGLMVGETTVTVEAMDQTATATIIVTDEEPVEPSIVVDPENVTLTTLEEGTTTATVTAAVTPAELTEDVVWTVEDPEVATVEGEGAEATITAVAEGATKVIATVDDLSAEVSVLVSNDPVIASGLEIIPNTPDYFSVKLVNVTANPAIEGMADVTKVSVFAWSNATQSDINAKVADNIEGTNDWIVEDIPVNETPVNNYFDIADSIFINVYASTDAADYMVAGDTYKWMNSASAGDNLVGYIAYSQNIGFDLPTVFDGAEAGTTGQALQMEGLRISSNVEGVEIQANVHVQNIGWLGYVADGTYAGTMHQNLQMEAVQLQLTGPNAANYQLRYRAHVQNIGWQDWVTTNQIAGTTGQALQIEAIEVELVPVN